MHLFFLHDFGNYPGFTATKHYSSDNGDKQLQDCGKNVNQTDPKMCAHCIRFDNKLLSLSTLSW